MPSLRGAGRPLMGRLNQVDKEDALERAKVAQKMWRSEHPNKAIEYRERYMNKEPSSVLKRFLTRIKNICIL